MRLALKVIVILDMALTCKLISESALCLLNEASDTPGGIWTTAPALGNHLINRLQEHAGVSFEIES